MRATVAREATDLWEALTARADGSVAGACAAPALRPRRRRAAARRSPPIAGTPRPATLLGDATPLPKRWPPCTSAAPSACTRCASSCAAACSSSASSPPAAWICCPTPTSPRSPACRIACRRRRSTPSSPASPTSSARPPSASPRFDAEPIAAASLAQVHAAALADGTPSRSRSRCRASRRLVEADLAALQMRRAGAARSAALDRHRDGRRRADPRRARRARLPRRGAPRRRLRGRASPAMPTSSCRASTPSTRRGACWCSSTSPATRLTDYLDACERRGADGARDRDRLFAILIRCFCAQVLDHGLLHADPHPGNFLVARRRGRAAPGAARLRLRAAYPPSAARAYAEPLPGRPGRRRRAHGGAVRAHGLRARATATTRRCARSRICSSTPSAPIRDRPLGDLDPRAAVERILRLTRDNPIVAVPPRLRPARPRLRHPRRPADALSAAVNLFQILMPYVTAAAS